MKIDRHEVIWNRKIGVPLIAVRDVLRKLDGTMFTRKHLTEHFKTDIADKLVVRGWITPGDEPQPGDDKQVYFKLTPQACRLLATPFLKRMSRAKADAVVAQMLERVRDINARTDLVYRVVKVTVFGSYIDQLATDFGDIDVNVELQFVGGSDRKLEREANRQRYAQSGFTSLDDLGQGFYGEKEVKRLIKGRSPYISMHPAWELEKMAGTPTRVIFPVP